MTASWVIEDIQQWHTKNRQSTLQQQIAPQVLQRYNGHGALPIEESGKLIEPFKSVEDRRTTAPVAEILGVNTHTAFPWRFKALSAGTAPTKMALNQFS